MGKTTKIGASTSSENAAPVKGPWDEAQLASQCLQSGWALGVLSSCFVSFHHFFSRDQDEEPVKEPGCFTDRESFVSCPQFWIFEVGIDIVPGINAIITDLADTAVNIILGTKNADMTRMTLRRLALIFLVCLKNFEQGGPCRNLPPSRESVQLGETVCYHTASNALKGPTSP